VVSLAIEDAMSMPNASHLFSGSVLRLCEVGSSGLKHRLQPRCFRTPSNARPSDGRSGS
jgi:hypothetical protein